MPVLYYSRLCATWFISRIVLHAAAAAAAPLRAKLPDSTPIEKKKDGKANTWRHFLSARLFSFFFNTYCRAIFSLGENKYANADGVFLKF